MSNSDLEVTFFHKDLHLKNGLQIHPVNQVKMTLKGVTLNANYNNTKDQPSPTQMPHPVSPLELGREGHRAMPLTQ